MKNIFTRSALIVMLFSAMGMSSVPSDADPGQQALDAGKQHTSKSHESHTVKPHAMVDLHYTLSKSFVVDTPETLNFNVVNRRDADDVKVRFSVDEGLILNTSPNEISFGAAPAGSEHGFSVQITPTANGLYYLDVFASMLIDGKYQSRAFAVPVSVGEYDPAKQHKPMGVMSEEHGEKMIIMPAVESTQ